MTAPCYKCEKRHELCHCTCYQYLTWKKGVDETRERRKQHDHADYLARDYNLKRCYKVR